MQEYWSGLPFPSPGDLPDPGIEPGSPALEADALTSQPPGKPRVPKRGRREAASPSVDPPEASQGHFHSLFLAGASHKASPEPRGPKAGCPCDGGSLAVFNPPRVDTRF